MAIQQKYIWADNMRVTATTGVILLHIAAPSLALFGTVADGSWWAANLYNSSMRFCVPLFVMLSGALLLPREYPLTVFLRKKLIRVLLPFLFWSLVYLGDKIRLLFHAKHPPEAGSVVKWAFRQIRDGSTSYHLWYVYMIIGIYLFIPIIGKWARNSSEKELLYFLGLCLIALLLSQPAAAELSPEFDLSYFSGFIGYLVLGYYLSEKRFKNPERITSIALVLMIAGIGITATGTYLLSAGKGTYASYFHSNFSPNVLLLSAGVFLYLRNRKYSGSPFRIRDFISKYSFGIYLVHVLVIRYLDIPILQNAIPAAAGIPAKALVCLAVSALIIFAVNKLPYGKYVSG